MSVSFYTSALQKAHSPSPLRIAFNNIVIDDWCGHKRRSHKEKLSEKQDHVVQMELVSITKDYRADNSKDNWNDEVD